MTAISQAVLVNADLAVQGMSADQRVKLADEIFLHQPNLLASVLVQQRMGSSLQQLEVLIHVLLVAYQAMKTSGHHWPVISEEVQERCLRRLTAKARFTEGLSPDLIRQAVQQQIDAHGEPYLLAFVHGYLGEHDLLGVKTDAEKYLLLAALNLPECIAATAASSPPSRDRRQERTTTKRPAR
jgi:hypothetical protein